MQRLTAYSYLVILIAFGILGGRQALSQYYAQSALGSGSQSDIDSAILFQAENPYAHEVRGMLFLQRNDYPSAAASFRDALDLRPGDYLLWLNYGTAQFRTGNVEGARSAFAKSIQMAPKYSRPRLSMGRLNLEIGNTDEAFRHLSTAAQLDPELYPEVLQLARTTFADDPVAIERAVTVESFVGRTIVAHYLIGHSWMTEGVRSFLMGDELSSEEKDAFIRELKARGDFATAREVWASRLGERVLDSPIFDGGFESISGSDPSGLGWQIDEDVSAVEVSRDGSDAHSGEYALYFRFSGNVGLRRPIVSQLAYVQPRRRYSLSFFSRVKDMVSAGMPAVVVSDATTNNTIAISKPLTDTAGAWVRYDIPFTATDAPVVLISLQRPACSTSPCPVFGELSLDDISIVEVPQVESR